MTRCYQPHWYRPRVLSWWGKLLVISVAALALGLSLQGLFWAIYYVGQAICAAKGGCS